MTIEITPQVVGVTFTALAAMFGAGYYLGDTRWVRRKDWHDHNNQIAGIIAKIQLDVQNHESQLSHGAGLMATLSSQVTQLNGSIGALNIALARMEGMHAARQSNPKGC